MIGRMMVSALALTGVAYAQTEAPQSETAASPGCAPQPACATAPQTLPNGRVAYDAGFFAQFNPQTALDMVRQTPGFSLDGGDDRRGFSGAVGNLLIDGLRPSTKSQSLDGILSRIPASQVVRIELLRGAEVAGDASGQAVLLNVVRTSAAGSGVYEAGFEITSRDVVAPRGEVSYSGRNGNFEYGVGASIFSQYRDLPGWRVFFDPPGTIVRRAETPSPRDFREATLNGNMAFPLAGGRLSATSQVNWWRYHADNDFLNFDTSDAQLDALLTAFEENRGSFEIGLNYDRDIGPWTLALIGLVNRARYESDEVGTNTDLVGTNDFTYAQDVRQDTGETILRGSLARALGTRHRIEFGAEGAFNTLDQQLAFVLDDGGGATPVFIPNSNVLVEEERAELFGSHTWRPADRWSLETRLAWETSTLTFSGDDNQEVELSFWKPSVQISRTFGENNQVRFRVYRDVGQLDFGDFVSANSVVDAIIAGGNTDLEPQTSWRAEIGADLRFPGGAALGLTLTHHQITDVADVVLLVATDDKGTPDPADDEIIRFDAPGNIGDGEATSLSLNFSSRVPVIPGARVTIEANLWDTEVTDPVTGQPRIISWQPESEVEVEFRQDLPSLQMAWGVNYYRQGEFQAYRFNEIDTNEEGPWVDLFVETTALPNDMKLRLWAANIFDGEVRRDRRFFNAPDRSGPNTSRMLAQRQFANAPWFILELTGTF